MTPEELRAAEFRAEAEEYFNQNSLVSFGTYEPPVALKPLGLGIGEESGEGMSMDKLFGNISLTHALTGNAIVSVVTLANIEQWLRLGLLVGSLTLTGVTLYYKLKSKGRK